MYVSKEDFEQSALTLFEDTNMEESTINAISQIIKTWSCHFEATFHTSQLNLSQEEIRVVPSEDQVTKETAPTVRTIFETEINLKKRWCSKDLQHSKRLIQFI